MNETAPQTHETNESPKKGGYNPDSGISYKEYLLNGGEMGQKLRDSAKAEATNRNLPKSENELRPVADGELGDDYLKFAENSDPEHEDYLPIGVMAHEPWTVAEKPNLSVSKVVRSSPAEPTQPEQPVQTDEKDGTYHLDSSDLFNGGRDRVYDNNEPPSTGYDGPVKPGSEIELAGPTDIEPYNPGPTEIVPVENGGELVQLPEVDPAMIEALDAARSRYAEATAKSRKSYLGRFLKQDTQVGGILTKLPGVKFAVRGVNWFKNTKLVSGSSQWADEKLFERSVLKAKNQYEDIYKAVSAATAAELARVGWEEDVVKQLSLLGNLAQDHKLENEIAFQRQTQSKDTNKFVNWWVNQKGFTGKLKKAGVIVGAGALTGLTAGIFAGATAAFLAGGATGAGIANHVTKRRANSIDKNGWTLAARQANADLSIKDAAIRSRHEADEVGSVEDITGRTERRTDEEVLGNRKRIKTAFFLGAAAGRGAFQLRELLNQPDKPGVPTVETPKKTPRTPRPLDPQPPTAPKSPTPGVPTINGQEFMVEHGHGFTHEIQEFAQVNGSNVDGKKAFDIYNEAVAKFGKDGLIDPMGTYKRVQGDFGIASPGSARWKPGVAEFLKSRL